MFKATPDGGIRAVSMIDDGIQAVSAVKERYDQVVQEIGAAMTEIEGAINQAAAIGVEGVAEQFSEIKQALEQISDGTDGLVDGVEKVIASLEAMKT